MQMNGRQIIVTAGLAMALLSMPIAARNGVMILLPDKRVAVLSEGDLEPGSIGSYSVAVFKDDSLTQLDTGAVFARDGSFVGRRQAQGTVRGYRRRRLASADRVQSLRGLRQLPGG
ncbi:PliI family lysozyme inhibitor of I-type lysozyme [Burkholderia vietnamiensis]|uniref:PliI family lysozyme inhibitor of I-type lysozyme n=1 Tax=Burkholderia vietnamiensis TaxID=60552 RepID=UPI00402ABDA6